MTSAGIGAETPTIVLRLYRPQDLDAIVALDRLCFVPEFQFSRPEMRSFAEAPGATTLIAEAEKQLAGFIIVAQKHPRSRDRYLVTLDVAASLTRRGVGTMLLRASERLPAISRMVLHVHTANSSAIAFYEQNGYQQARLIRGFYSDVPGGGDAFQYEKIIASPEAGTPSPP